MRFTEAVSSVLRQYANFRGRAPRSEFWWFYLFTVLVSIVTSIVDGALGTPVIGMLASLALILPSLAVGVRRLHDSDLSGWWLAPIIAASVIGGFMVAGSVVVLAMSVGGVEVLPDSATPSDLSQMTGPAAVVLVIGGLLLLAGFVGSLVMGLRRSTPGPNRFGPPYGGQGQYMPYGEQFGGHGYPVGHGYGTPPPHGVGPGSTGYPPPPGSSAYPPPPGSTYPPNPGSSPDHGGSPDRRPPDE